MTLCTVLIIKYCTKCHLVGTFLKLIHDARNDKHKTQNSLYAH
jgi:hypothetical protein